MEDEEDNYDMGDDVDYDMGDDDMKDELENLFLEAKNAEDPITAYRNVIELEASNSSDKSITINSYKEICILYLIRDDYENFSKEIQNLIKESKYLKEDIFKTKLFDEILTNIKQNQDKEEFQLLDFSKFLNKMLNSAEDIGYWGLVDEIKNFIEKYPKYNKILKEKESTFSFYQDMNQ